MKVACVLLPDFEVAAELTRYPDLTGKPVIVGGLPHERKTVRSRSQEAAAFGVTEGMPLREAQGLCPEAIFLPADDDLYRKLLSRVLSTLDAFSPRVEAVSHQSSVIRQNPAHHSLPITHHPNSVLSPQSSVLVFLDASGLKLLFGPDQELGERIVTALEARIRLVPAVGIATSKFVAQMAATVTPPGTARVVNPGEERAFLAPMPAEWIPCTKEMRRRLDLFGLRTMGQLAALPRGALGEQFGPEGIEAARLARGIDERPIVTRDVPTVMREEIEIDPPAEESQRILAAADQLARRLERQMKATFVACRDISLDLGFENEDVVHLSTTLHEPSGRAIDLLGAVERFLGRVYARLSGVREPPLPAVSGLSLSISGFTAPHGEQLELLPTRAGGLKKIRQTVQRSEEMFGGSAIRPLSEAGQDRLLLNRIGVTIGLDGLPEFLFLANRQEEVREVSNRWRVQEEWWRREVLREYYRVITHTGKLCLIYHDLLDGGWFLERVYE